MGLTLAQMREHIYTFFELDTDDVPHALIDTWAGEGYRRIAYLRKNWPFYEGRTVLTLEANRQSYTDAEFGGYRSIESIVGPDGPLDVMHRHDATAEFGQTDGTFPTGRPEAVAEWADDWYVYPTPDAAHELTIIGYRNPTPWGTVAGDEPDIPDLLHDAILMWVKYRTYLHADDTYLAEVEKYNFEETMDRYVKDLTASEATLPLTIGGGRSSRRRMMAPRPPSDWD